MEEGMCDGGPDKKEDSPKPARKSWLELKSVVCELRRQLSSLSSSVPGSIAFRALSFNGSETSVTRVYFLATPPGFWESTLLYVDICAGGCAALNPNSRLQWHHLIEGSFHSVNIGNLISGSCQSGSSSSAAKGGGAREGGDSRTSGATRWSREEQLQWERRRVATWGIASYELHPQSGLVVFPSAGSLFQCRDPGIPSKSGPLFPSEFDQVIQGVCHEAMLNPEICPWDPSMVAFVSESDIWVTRLPTESGTLLCNSVSTVRMTHSYRGCGRSLADDPLSSGIPSYVTQEEFSRYQGFWWQPHSYDGTYRILYEEVDESDVTICHFPTFTFADSTAHDVEEFRFPRAGTPNAKWTLKMIEFSTGPRRIWELKQPISELFPWAEYLVRAGWSPGGLEVWVQLLDRRQQRLELVIIPLSCFSVLCSEDPAPSLLAGQSVPSSAGEDVKWGAGGPQLAGAERKAGGELASLPQVVHTQHSSTWINVCDLLYFFKSGGQDLGLPSLGSNAGRTLCFVIGNEETGFRHLYLVVVVLATDSMVGMQYGRFQRIRFAFPESNCAKDISSPLSHSSAEDEEGEVVGAGPRELWVPNGLDSREEPKDSAAEGSCGAKELGYHAWALTFGEWEVVGGGSAGCGGGGGGGKGGGCGMGKPPLWVDEDRGLIYFIGLRESALERHLYAVSVHRPGHVRLLSQLGHSHSAEFNQDCSLLALVFSSIQQPPACQLYRVAHTGDTFSVEEILLIPLGYLLEPSAPVAEQLCPDLYAHRISSGETLHAMVFKPHSFRPGKRYPTVLYVYGGPEVQLVSNVFKGMRSLRMHMLAALGYCVVAIDSRGSQHRGVRFESHLRCRMGTVELSDQVEVLQWLCSRLGFIHPERIAIHGWSYGGYLSLLALVHHPEVFKVAVAGAPVTSWHLYDTGYTERYMDLPTLNPDGYKNGSVLSHAHLFPEEANRLLVIHGLMDENVHFVHTSELIGALVRAGKPYQLQIYPNERHSLRHLDASKHYEMTLLSFLENHL